MDHKGHEVVGLWVDDMRIRKMTLDFGLAALMVSDYFSILILLWLSAFPAWQVWFHYCDLFFMSAFITVL